MSSGDLSAKLISKARQGTAPVEVDQLHEAGSFFFLLGEFVLYFFSFFPILLYFLIWGLALEDLFGRSFFFP